LSFAQKIEARYRRTPNVLKIVRETPSPKGLTRHFLWLHALFIASRKRDVNELLTIERVTFLSSYIDG
jgi:hypothetical protein